MTSRQKEQKNSDEFGLIGSLTITKLRDGVPVWRSAPMKNKVVTSDGYGRNLILRWMMDDSTYPIVIDSAAVGDDDTAAADGDTALGNALVSSIPITNKSVSNNIMTIDVFVADGNLADDTYEEFGLFANGRLMSRLVMDPAYTKVSGEDTLFTYTLTMTG